MYRTPVDKILKKSIFFLSLVFLLLNTVAKIIKTGEVAVYILWKVIISYIFSSYSKKKKKWSVAKVASDFSICSNAQFWVNHISENFKNKLFFSIKVSNFQNNSDSSHTSKRSYPTLGRGVRIFSDFAYSYVRYFNITYYYSVVFLELYPHTYEFLQEFSIIE